jgi:hypothetical protein
MEIFYGCYLFRSCEDVSQRSHITFSNGNGKGKGKGKGKDKCKGIGKFHPITGREGPEVE